MPLKVDFLGTEANTADHNKDQEWDKRKHETVIIATIATYDIQNVWIKTS